MAFRLDRALRTMSQLAGFETAFLEFVQEKARKDMKKLLEKDPPRSDFKRSDMEQFSYYVELEKFQSNSPTLIAAIAGTFLRNLMEIMHYLIFFIQLKSSGTLSRAKGDDVTALSRPGFGGSNRSEPVDLIQTVVQSVSRLIRCRHPDSLSKIPCMNSLFLWSHNASQSLFEYFNGMGDCYRFV